MDISIEHQELVACMLGHVDGLYRTRLQHKLMTELEIHGVRVPELREIIKEWKHAHKTSKATEILALFELLWHGKSREERLLACYLLQSFPSHMAQLSLEKLDQWRAGIDNWEVADAFAQYILGVWILEFPDSRVTYLWDLIADEEKWSRRLALVATTFMNRHYKESAFPDLTLALVDIVKTERDPMITKAVSWALRVLGERHAASVRVYLEENAEILAKSVMREVLHKLLLGRKRG